MPDSTSAMDPVPDHGETSYKGSGRLAGKKTVIAGGDSGIGRAVALAAVLRNQLNPRFPRLQMKYERIDRALFGPHETA